MRNNKRVSILNINVKKNTITLGGEDEKWKLLLKETLS